LTDVGLVDNLPSSPAQMTLSNPDNLAFQDCGSSPTVTAPNNGTAITISNATIAPNTVCQIQVVITATTPGTYNNTTNPVTTSQGSFGTASASVVVTQIP